MEPPRFSAELLANYIHQCMSRQTVVTVNLEIYQEIGPQAIQCMAEVRRKIRGA